MYRNAAENTKGNCSTCWKEITLRWNFVGFFVLKSGIVAPRPWYVACASIPQRMCLYNYTSVMQHSIAIFKYVYSVPTTYICISEHCSTSMSRYLLWMDFMSEFCYTIEQEGTSIATMHSVRANKKHLLHLNYIIQEPVIYVWPQCVWSRNRALPIRKKNLCIF